MTKGDGFPKELGEELAALPPFLRAEFQRATAAVAPFPPDKRRLWAQEGLRLARFYRRSWEALVEYLKAAPQALGALTPEAFLSWCQWGQQLTQSSATLGAAYYRASPKVFPYLAPSQVGEWAALAWSLCRGTWRSTTLATQFLEVSPSLLPSLPLSELGLLIRLIDTLAQHAHPLAAACLELAPQLIASLDSQDRRAFLAFAQRIAEVHWADIRLYLERGPELLRPVAPSERERFLALAEQMALRAGRQAYHLFAEGAQALARLPAPLQQQVLSLAQEVAAHSPVAALEFLKKAPHLLEHLRWEELALWQAEGLNLLAQSPEGGEAYFRLESLRSQEALDAIASRVELSRVRPILQMYCQALSGVEVAIQPASELAEKGIGWVSSERPSTEGTAIYLPETVAEYQSKEENFTVLKVYATHQAAHLEFRSFEFRWDRPGQLFPSRRFQWEEERGGPRSPLTDMERFFDLFDDRRLIADLFTVAEDTRIDFLVSQEYGGIRPHYRRRQEEELKARPPVEELPLRQAFLENLVRLSLGAPQAMRWPLELLPLLRQAVAILEALKQPQAQVEDAAEAALRLYELAIQIPNLEQPQEWEPFPQEEMPPQAGSYQDQEVPAVPMPQGEEKPYKSPKPVDFRGDFKPEMVQLLNRLREEHKAQEQKASTTITPEQLQQLLEKSVELFELAEKEMPISSDLFMANILKELGQPPDQGERQARGTLPFITPEENPKELAQVPKAYYYDEWDFRAGDYKPRWCRLWEHVLGEGDVTFYEETLRRYAGLVNRTKRQFELLKPELYRKVKRVLDGEDLDLDAVIEHWVERRARRQPSGKVYWRRNKVERDVAVIFLLDMSASTDEEITKRQYHLYDDYGDDPRRHLSWWANRRTQLTTPPKRIIDLEKESLVLLTKALEALGDAYGIYGFSGYGRENVEFYIIKDLNEAFSDRIKQRIDKMAPVRSTRMGPAIRHATYKLSQYEAKIRILFLISDGRPQDHGYGRDRTEKEYAIHDTHKALLEAKQRNIIPFCLTVDKEGHDYLGAMCGDIGYAVVGDIEALPSRLLTLYRSLTT